MKRFRPFPDYPSITLKPSAMRLGGRKILRVVMMVMMVMVVGAGIGAGVSIGVENAAAEPINQNKILKSAEKIQKNQSQKNQSQKNQSPEQSLSLQQILAQELTNKERQFIKLIHTDQKQPLQLLSLQNALAQGLKNNLTLQNRGLQYDFVQQALKEVSAIFDPEIQISAGYGDNETFERRYTGTVKRSGFRLVPDDMNPFEIPREEEFEETDGNPVAPSGDTQPKVIEVLFNAVTAGIERGYDIEASKAQTDPNQTKTYGLTLSQTLPWGGSLALTSSNLDHDIYYRKDFHWDRSWTSNVTFAIETALPFSKNFAQGFEQQLAIQLARVEQNREYWQVKDTLNDLLAEIDTTYWDLVQSYEQLLIQKHNQALLQRQLQHVTSLYQQYLVTQYDIKQIEVEWAAARVNYQAALTQVTSTSLRLKQLINQEITSDESLLIPYQYESILQPTNDSNGPQSEQADQSTPSPSQSTPSPSQSTPSRSQSIAMSQRFHPQIQIQKLALKSSGINQQFAQHQTRPDITLRAELANQQDNSQLGYQSLGKSLSAQPDTQSQNYQLNYRYPLFNRAANSRLKQAELTRDKTQITLTDTQLRLEQQIDQAINDLDSAQRQQQLAENIKNLATLALEQLNRKREIGGDYKEVEWLLNQRKLNQAELQAINAKINTQKSQTALRQAQGLLAHQQLQNLPDFERYRIVELDKNQYLRFFIPLWFE